MIVLLRRVKIELEFGPVRYEDLGYFNFSGSLYRIFLMKFHCLEFLKENFAGTHLFKAKFLISYQLQALKNLPLGAGFNLRLNFVKYVRWLKKVFSKKVFVYPGIFEPQYSGDRREQRVAILRGKTPPDYFVASGDNFY